MELKKEEERKEENIPKRDAQVFDGLIIGNCSDDFFVVAVEREGVECGRVCYPSNISSKKKEKEKDKKKKKKTKGEILSKACDCNIWLHILVPQRLLLRRGDVVKLMLLAFEKPQHISGCMYNN